ncbi:MAG TPA: GtrA family protein [Arthrobacter sp.]|nr:GtrA family protein [Arthrobacter sp.]
MIILIPAYEPDAQLLEVIGALHAADPSLSIVVVDDGSGPDYRVVFDAASQAGAYVISHSANRGKGSALKTGFGFILERFPGQDVVCADSDGQHSVVDILRVAGLAGKDASCMVLGARAFAGDVPARSRIGNAATRLLFRLATGERIADTQTGLRGYPSALLPWLLTVGGERYEYELNLLLEAKAAGYRIASVGIATIYLDHNSGSHFRPLADSVRIYAPLLKFLLSSFAGFMIDTVAFLALSAATGSILGAVVGARCLSATANFLINRRLVFKHGRAKPAGTAAARYFLLALFLLAANYALVAAFAGAGVADLPAKLLTEMTLLAVSYAIQQRFLFAAGHKPDLVPAQPRHSLAVNRSK